MKSIIYICPTGNNKPVGGIKIIYRHAEILSEMLPENVEAKIFHFQDINFRCDWFTHKVKFKKDNTFNNDQEFAIIPEWMAVYHAKILQKTNVKYAIFVQNGFYLNTKPKNNFNDQDIYDAYEKSQIIISYSDEISECVKLAFPKLKHKIFRINLSIDHEKFNINKDTFDAKENLITYMPRKKSDHAEKLLFFLRNNLSNKWKIESLDNLNEIQVAEYLKKSKIFLSFSELEGFGLPPVEAALCGNYVIGYTGESGKEYWNTPIFDEVLSGDLRAFANKILNKIKKNDTGDTFDTYKAAIKKLAEKYSIKNERDSLLSLLNKIKEF